MEKIQEINDICKEVITVLAFFNENLIEQIPNKTLKKLNELAADSNSNFYIDTEKELEEQTISEECKDLIALLYYSYIANEDEKKELLKIWNENEKIFQNKLHEMYNTDNIFKNIDKQQTTNIKTEATKNALIEYKESFFVKLKTLIFRILHINN